MKRIFRILLILALMGGQFSTVHAVVTTPAVLPYEGVLKTPGGTPITSAHDFRFSIWNDSDFDAPADFDGAGSIPGGAPGFSGYQEVQTVTPDSAGFFQINIGAVTPIPDFNTTTHLYLQVEIKTNGSPNTSYEVLDIDGAANANDRQAFGTVPYARNADFLDNAEIGTAAGNIPTLGLGGVFSTSFIPAGSDQNNFILDADNTGGDVTLQFGGSLNESLKWDSVNSEFDLSDDLSVSGNVVVSGVTNTSGITSTGSVNFSGSTQFRVRESSDPNVNAACAAVSELIFNTTTNQLMRCTTIGNPGTWTNVDTTGGTSDLDAVYNNDADKTLAVNNALGLKVNSSVAGNILFNLQNTGDVVIQDNGTTFALFSDSGLFEVRGLENTERIRLTDTTNSDSVGMYVGTGTPNGIINAQAGSVYYDELGAIYVNNSVGSGTTWNKISLDKAQTVTVAKSGGDFTSVKAAVDSITDASVLKPYVVHVHPGVYTEDPITLPSFVSIIGQGTATIVASTPTGVLITAGASTRVDSVILSGASGVGGVCYRSTATSLISNMQFSSCETGILATGATSTLSGLNLSAISGVFTDFIRVESGATFLSSTVVIRTTGIVSKGLNIIGANTAAEVSSFVITSLSVTDGAYVDNGATLTLLNSNIKNTVNGIHVGPNGSSFVRGTGGIIENSSQYTIYVESASTHFYYDALQTQKEKFNVHPDSLFSVTFNNLTLGEEGTNVFGRFSVGSPENPDDTYLGQGDSYTNGMLVYTFDGVNYTDVTAAASNPVGTPFSFPGVAAGNSIYISTDREASGDFVKFTGFHYTTTSTVADMGAGQIVQEYWDGSSWQPFNKNCVHGTLHFVYEGHCFERPDSYENNNFEVEIIEDWTKNDPPSTGTDRYWIRLRIASNIVIAPVFEQFKIHPDSVKINSNGSIEFIGRARFHRDIISHLGMFFGTGSNAPANVSFSVGTGGGFTQDLERASFRGSGVSLDEVSGSITLPLGIDTSSNLDPIIYWKKTNNNLGNIQWKIDATLVGAENVHVTDGSNVPTAPRATGEDLNTITIQTIETLPDGNDDTVNQVIASSFQTGIDISQYYQGDQLFLRLYRDAADPDDTYNSDAVIVGFRINGTFWRLGGEHEEF